MGMIILFYFAGLLPVLAFLLVVLAVVRHTRWRSVYKTIALAIVATIAASPVFMPAGITAVFVPFGVALPFLRSTADLHWFATHWPINIPLLAMTAVVCLLISRRIFSGPADRQISRTGTNG
jgi:hypothetical protein